MCPKCGGLLEDCTSDYETGPDFVVKRRRCRASDELITEQDATKIDRPDAVLWSVRKKE